MKIKKVFYKEGDNQKFNFYLVAKKEEVKIDKNTLAYNFSNKSDKSLSIQFNGVPIGNADIMLRMETKEGFVKSHIFCSYSDIDEI